MSMYPNQNQYQDGSFYYDDYSLANQTNFHKGVLKSWIDKNCPEILNPVQVSTVYVDVPIEVEKEVIKEISVEVVPDTEQIKIEMLSAISNKMDNLSSMNIRLEGINSNLNGITITLSGLNNQLSCIVYQNEHPKPVPVYYA